MNNYAIVTDSSCDLTDALVRELDLHVVPLAFVMEDRTYWNYPDNRDISPDEFYRRLAEGAMATTNAVNVAQASDQLEPLLREGKDVLVMAFSSGLSATCDSFRIAARELGEKYPERKLYVVDTLCASLGQGMLVYRAARLRAGGASIEEVRDWAEENKLRQCHWFTVNDLFHLKRGGRVSAATAVVGTMLQIKPVMHVDDEGRLVKVTTARGRKAALLALVDKVGESGADPAEQTMFISYSACREDAEFVAGEISRRYGTRGIILNSVGPVIGAHTGLGCVALFFEGRQR